MADDVSLQVALLSKRRTADFTLKRSFVVVLFYVSPCGAVVIECSIANFTFERSLSGVNAFMSDQMLFVTESCTAHFAQKRFFTRVDLSVCHQTVFIIESHGTHITKKLTLTSGGRRATFHVVQFIVRQRDDGVNAQMFLQVALRGECRLAQQTAERSNARVHAHMCFHVTAVAKCGAAHLAGTGSFTGVDQLVLLQPVVATEGCVAQVAFERSLTRVCVNVLF